MDEKKSGGIVVNLNQHKGPTIEEQGEALYEKGKEALVSELENSQAFLTVLFDKESNPQILFAGDLDPFTVTGVLEYAKQNFLAHVLETTVDYDILDLDDDQLHTTDKS